MVSVMFSSSVGGVVGWLGRRAAGRSVGWLVCRVVVVLWVSHGTSELSVSVYFSSVSRQMSSQSSINTLPWHVCASPQLHTSRFPLSGARKPKRSALFCNHVLYCKRTEAFSLPGEGFCAGEADLAFAGSDPDLAFAGSDPKSAGLAFAGSDDCCAVPNQLGTQVVSRDKAACKGIKGFNHCVARRVLVYCKRTEADSLPGEGFCAGEADLAFAGSDPDLALPGSDPTSAGLAFEAQAAEQQALPS